MRVASRADTRASRSWRAPVAIAHDVFISYATSDKTIADAVCHALEAAGVRCWIAPRDIPPGADRREAIATAIGASRVVVVVFSSHANGPAQIMGRRAVAYLIDSAAGAGILALMASQDATLPPVVVLLLRVVEAAIACLVSLVPLYRTGGRQRLGDLAAASL